MVVEQIESMPPGTECAAEATACEVTEERERFEDRGFTCAIRAEESDALSERQFYVPKRAKVSNDKSLEAGWSHPPRIRTSTLCPRDTNESSQRAARTHTPQSSRQFPL